MTDNTDETGKESRIKRRDVIKAGAGAALLGGATSQSARAQSESTATGPTVYVGSQDNNLYALDAATGTQQWQFETGNNVQSSPTEMDGSIYFGAGSTHMIDVGLLRTCLLNQFIRGEGHD